jgi:hypothetical protein
MAGMRVDRRQDLFRPTRSGKPPVVPGNPAQSRVVNVLLEPAGSRSAMPPRGLPPLEPHEVGEVIDWIRSGAPVGE